MPHTTYQIRDADLTYLILLDQFLSTRYVLASFYELNIKKSISSKSDRAEITTRELTFFIINEFLEIFKKDLYQSTDVRQGYFVLDAHNEYYKNINRKICNSITRSEYVECCKRNDDVSHYRWVSVDSEKTQEFQTYFVNTLDGKKQTVQHLLANEDLLIKEITATIFLSKQELEQQKTKILTSSL